MHVDLAFHFIKHLFLENIIDNPVILGAILNNEVESISDFERLATLNYTKRFQQVTEKLKKQIKEK